MGYIREPKNVNLVVGPSVFTEATRQTIAQAIAQYNFSSLLSGRKKPRQLTAGLLNISNKRLILTLTTNGSTI